MEVTALQRLLETGSHLVVTGEEEGASNSIILEQADERSEVASGGNCNIVDTHFIGNKVVISLSSNGRVERYALSVRQYERRTSRGLIK